VGRKGERLCRDLNRAAHGLGKEQLYYLLALAALRLFCFSCVFCATGDAIHDIVPKRDTLWLQQQYCQKLNEDGNDHRVDVNTKTMHIRR